MSSAKRSEKAANFFVNLAGISQGSTGNDILVLELDSRTGLNVKGLIEVTPKLSGGALLAFVTMPLTRMFNFASRHLHSFLNCSARGQTDALWIGSTHLGTTSQVMCGGLLLKNRQLTACPEITG